MNNIDRNFTEDEKLRLVEYRQKYSKMSKKKCFFQFGIRNLFLGKKWSFFKRAQDSSLSRLNQQSSWFMRYNKFSK